MQDRFHVFVTLRDSSKIERIVGSIVSKGWTVGPIAENIFTGTSPVVMSAYITTPSNIESQFNGCDAIRNEVIAIINKLGANYISIVVTGYGAALAWKAGSLDAPKKSTAQLSLVKDPETTQET